MTLCNFFREVDQADYFFKEKEAIVTTRKRILERKEAAKSALRDYVWEAYELDHALKLPGCTEETRKAHVDAQKMVEIFAAEVKRKNATLVALDEEEKTLDNAIEAIEAL